MQDLVIRGRRGNRISVGEYPAGYFEALNARLDELAVEDDDELLEATA